MTRWTPAAAAATLPARDGRQKTMGTVTIRIPLVTWREGKPRYYPSAAQRKLGYHYEDLRHEGPASPSGLKGGTKTGRWFSLDEAISWSRQRQQEIAARKTEKPAARKFRSQAQPQADAVAHIISQWLETPRLKGEAVSEGRRRREALAANTIRYYKQAARLLERLEEGLYWAMPAAAFDGQALSAALKKAEEQHGLAQARGLRAMVSTCWRWAKAGRLCHENPVESLEETMPMPPARVRAETVEGIFALAAAADACGRPEIGDAVLMGVFTCQRQGDRLSALQRHVSESGIRFEQQKKRGEALLIPLGSFLQARLEAARLRRTDWKVVHPQIIQDETARQPFKPDHYRHVYAQVREVAAQTHPQLADLRDQDLRDTGLSWAALAGCNTYELAALSGHAFGGREQVLRHYVANDLAMARSAVAKVEKWVKAELARAAKARKAT